jgi:hypothetical protein
MFGVSKHVGWGPPRLGASLSCYHIYSSTFNAGACALLRFSSTFTTHVIKLLQGLPCSCAGCQRYACTCEGTKIRHNLQHAYRQACEQRRHCASLYCAVRTCCCGSLACAPPAGWIASRILSATTTNFLNMGAGCSTNSTYETAPMESFTAVNATCRQ